VGLGIEPYTTRSKDVLIKQGLRGVGHGSDTQSLANGICSIKPNESATEGGGIRNEANPDASTHPRVVGLTVTMEGATAHRGGAGPVATRLDTEARTGEAELAATVVGATTGAEMGWTRDALVEAAVHIATELTR
jgi:hypothetical protein